MSTPGRAYCARPGAALALLFVLALSACGSSGSRIDKRNPPAGATPAEFGFQYAQAIAKNGNCDQALPIFICLGSQGPGWALAMHSGGVCALEAAKSWTGSLHLRSGFYARQSKVNFNRPSFQSRTALRAKGLKLLRSSAAAGWPDSQAVLVRELSSAGSSAQNLGEAKAWLQHYDRNKRRKIYGANTLGPRIRARLAGLAPSADARARARLQPLTAQPLQDAFCKRLVRHRTGAPRQPMDDGLEKLPGRRSTPRHQRRPDTDGDHDLRF